MLGKRRKQMGEVGGDGDCCGDSEGRLDVSCVLDVSAADGVDECWI